MKINECTIVAGKKDTHRFLFKNGDNPVIYDHEIIRDIINNVEVVYYTNQKGWVEGMNEFGIGMVYAFLATDANINIKQEQNKNARPSKNDIDPYFLSEKGKSFLDIISSKTMQETLDKIKQHNYNGNYFVPNKQQTYEIEIFNNEIKIVDVNFTKTNDYRVKTNYGTLIPTAGQIADAYNLRRSDAEIRKGNAERYLQGFKTFDDVMLRMGFQEFDSEASYNLFRTDKAEKTNSQVLMDLGKIPTFYFIYHDESEKYQGVLDKTSKSYEPKIKIVVYDKNKMATSEFLTFLKMKNGLSHLQGKD